MAKVRVRFAPSPTGELHIGGARTALFNYLFARKHDGVFILRIDDSDEERSRPEYVEGLMESLRWLGLDWDEGPYFQSQNLERYHRAANLLLENKKAYRCYCTPEELEAGREEARRKGEAYLYPGKCRNLTPEQEEKLRAAGRVPVVRLLTPDRGETVVEDLIRGSVRFDNALIDDFIIIKSSGLPTYNFASVVDDAQLEISHVIRAEEHLSNTPRQILCARALGCAIPSYAHLPMILAPDRSKLSKRHGATAVEEFREKGYLPEALVNYMCLLGWSPSLSGDEEILPLEEMIARFSLERVNKTAAIYDTEKLTWMNGHYLREGNLERITRLAVPFFAAKGLVSPNPGKEELGKLQKVVSLMRERAKTLSEMAEASSYFYSADYEYDPRGWEKHFSREGTGSLIDKIAGELEALPDFKPGTIEEAFARLAQETSLSLGRLIQPVRLSVSGRTGGPDFYELLSFLGREETVRRLRRTVQQLEGR
ncbi:MAG TPA: glutamate--tRNA ligase [Bacillota bacterium]|nr:glutamate--tRNA ligase [Bacillota bacterium]HOB87120.1 glutamate--tRNA ligase [Bacillota bacterium]HOP69586.1 glutamate--tRNA ligase [Bacillota bacterium]HPT34515.1 glutamate--tRNA ligase [Bacillota bacterium]HPZ64738.1 glutamate--tRNA ligase [Bacillota bacterium]